MHTRQVNVLRWTIISHKPFDAVVAVGDQPTVLAALAAEALELLPEDMRETAVACLLEQAEKFRVLKAQVTEGLDDVAAAGTSRNGISKKSWNWNSGRQPCE